MISPERKVLLELLEQQIGEQNDIYFPILAFRQELASSNWAKNRPELFAMFSDAVDRLNENVINLAKTFGKALPPDWFLDLEDELKYADAEGKDFVDVGTLTVEQLRALLG